MNKSELLIALPKEIKRVQRKINYYKGAGKRGTVLDILECIRHATNAVDHSDGFAMLQSYNELRRFN